MNPERAMDSARSAARGHWRMRKARHTEKGKPERNGRRSREIGAQAVRSKLGRRNFDLGRARWMRGGCDRMNGQAKDLSDRNACFIYDTDERGSGIGGECSLIFAYVRLCSHIGRKNVESPARGHRGRSRIAQLQIADWRMRIADWAAWTALPGARSAGRANSSRSADHLAISGVSNAVLSPRLQRIKSGPKRPRHLAELRGQDPRAMPAGLPLDFIHQTLQWIE